MRHVLLTGLAAAALCGAPSTAAAQRLRGTVRDSATTQPIAGAVVVLLDSAGTVLTRRLTNERGEFSSPLAASVRRMQVMRIGFRPAFLNVPLLETDIAQADVRLASIPTLIAPARIVDDSRCPRRRDRAAALGLWDQARAGLLTSVVSRDVRPTRMVRLRFKRTMEGTGDVIESQEVIVDSAGLPTRPFGAAFGAGDFVTKGFAFQEGSGITYFAPDADVLLEDAFARGYCFHLMDRVASRPGQVGLGFTAMDHERGRVEVEGALWIDSVKREVRDIEFRYVGLDRVSQASRPGGRVEFRKLDNGLVVIDRWVLRLVRLHEDTIFTAAGRAQLVAWGQVVETGGELARATWPGGFSWQASLGTVQVTAMQGGVPAAGAAIRLADTDYLGITDERGRMTIADLVPGPYSAIVVDPALVPVGVTIPTTLKFRAERARTTVLTLELPTAADFIAKACQAAKRDVDDGGRLIVRVVTPDGKPVDGARWKVTRIDALGSHDIELVEGGRSGTDGLFHWCKGLPYQREPGQQLEVRAWLGDRAGTVKVPLTQRVTALTITIRE